MSKSSFLFRQNDIRTKFFLSHGVFFRQKDIRTKFYLFDIRLAMPLAYLGGKKTYFFAHGMHGNFYVILLSNS